MPNVAGTVTTGYLRRDSFLVQHLRHAVGNIQDAELLATADVDRVSGGFRPLHREPAGERHVVNRNKIAILPAVLVNNRRLIIEVTRGEDRQHSGVWIRKRLP